MASTASDLIKFEKMATGEKSGTWGTLANTAMSRIEESIAGFRAITLAGSTYVLDDTQYLENSTTTSESHLAMIKAVGTPGASRQITVPLRTKLYLFWNAVTTYDMTVAGASGDSITVTNGNLAWVFCDGTNVELASPMFTTAGIIDASALPAASLTAVGGIEVATVAETNTGSDATRAVSPDGLDGWTGSAQVATVGTITSGAWTGTAVASSYMASATASAKGAVELATDAETITGTDTARAVTPANIQAKVASATAKGIAELATTAETVTGTDTGRVVTPAGLHGALAGLSDATITASDTIIFADVGSSNALKEDTVQGILDLAGGLPSGMISAYGGSSAPTGWLFCDGTTGKDSVADTSLADLFTAIGTTYGGAGAADFDLPDLRGRIPLGLDNLGGSSANRMTASAADGLGGSGGTETHTLTTSEMPAHTHSGAASMQNDTRGNINDQTSATGTTTTGSTGGGGAHANDQPWLAIGYIIKI